MRDLVDRIRALPAVERASVAAILPTGGGRIRFGELTAPGVTPPDGRRFLEADWNLVEPDYFAAMRIPLLTGRDFNDGDREGAAPVAIVSKEAAQRFWPGQDPLRKQLVLHPPQIPGVSGAVRTLTVVGMAGDIRWAGAADSPARPFVYIPWQQQYVESVTVVARTIEGQ